jgi:hypothetical protein
MKVSYPVPRDFIENYAHEDRNALIPSPIWVKDVHKIISKYQADLEGIPPTMMYIPPLHMGKLLEYIDRLEMHITRLIQEQ